MVAREGRMLARLVLCNPPTAVMYVLLRWQFGCIWLFLGSLLADCLEARCWRFGSEPPRLWLPPVANKTCD
jgi:hypothetical protein